jgi:hypothetical protein
MNALPTPDALPLPGPVWLFEVLLHLTFVLHLLFMNFLLGGSVIALIERLRARSAGGRNAGAAATADGHFAVARWIETKLPATMAFTVTLGVAPLLFVQALYGHLFYSSSVLMAWPWLSVIGLLLVTYSLVYRLSFGGGTLGGGQKVIGVLISLGLLTIAFLYVNNMTLAIRPEVWAAKYAARPDGTSLNVDDPTFWPRLLHFVIAALAVAGVILAVVGAKRVQKGDESGRSWLRLGAFWFAVPTLLQFVSGLWWLLMLERTVMMQFMGQDLTMTILFAASMFLPIFALVMMALSIKADRPFALVHGSAHLLLLTIIGMVIVRHGVRVATLEPVFTTDALQIVPMWSVFALFALLLVIALATTAWMLVAMARAPRASD